MTMDGPDATALPAARAKNRYFRVLELINGLCLAVMVVMVFVNVVLRYLFGTGIAASEELARLAFVWLIFIGAVLALRERGHIGVDMMVRRLSPRGRRLCLLINDIVMLWVLWLLGSGSWEQTIIGLTDVTPVTGIPVATFNVAGLFVAVSMAAIVLAEMWKLLTGRISDAEIAAWHGHTGAEG
jgi:TRAP-type C4-dicarboxylate transport system permease small subunit